jgi:hypothetical protein
MRPDFNPFDSSMRQSKYGGHALPSRVPPRRGIFADPSHKSAFAKLHDADPGRGMRKVLMCVMVRVCLSHPVLYYPYPTLDHPCPAEP